MDALNNKCAGLDKQKTLLFLIKLCIKQLKLFLADYSDCFNSEFKAVLYFEFE